MKNKDCPHCEAKGTVSEQEISIPVGKETFKTNTYRCKKCEHYALTPKIRKEMDAEKRIKEVEYLQEAIDGEKPAIFLFSPYYLYVSVKNLGGLEGGLLITPSDRFKNINEWYLETSRILK